MPVAPFPAEEPIDPKVEAANIVLAIDAGNAAVKGEKPRTYIGASVVGKKCDAYLAYSLRGFPEDAPSPRLRRIFKLGHVIEEIVVADLKRAGIHIMEVDPLTGKQYNLRDFGGHVSCNLDGVVEMPGERLRVVEIKSMNGRLWKLFQSKGVRVSHPQYFDQMQMMMGMGGFEDAMFIAYNKDTSEYEVEIVAFDEIEWSFLQGRIERALMGKVSKITANPDDWRCKGCFRHAVCWKGAKADVACVSCRYAAPLPSGGWHCARHGKEARNVCADYEQFEASPHGATT